MRANSWIRKKKNKSQMVLTLLTNPDEDDDLQLILEAIEAHWNGSREFFLDEEPRSWMLNTVPQPVRELAEDEPPGEEDDRYCYDFPPSTWRMELVTKRFALVSGFIVKLFVSAATGGTCAALMSANGEVLAEFFLYDMIHFVSERSLRMVDGTREKPYEEDDGHMGYNMWLFAEEARVFAGTIGDGREALTTFWQCERREFEEAWIATFGSLCIEAKKKKQK